jgi:hypothetical protein
MNTFICFRTFAVGSVLGLLGLRRFAMAVKHCGVASPPLHPAPSARANTWDPSHGDGAPDVSSSPRYAGRADQRVDKGRWMFVQYIIGPLNPRYAKGKKKQKRDLALAIDFW